MVSEIVYCEAINDQVEIVVKLIQSPIPTSGKFGLDQIPVSATCEHAATCEESGSTECRVTTNRAMYE